MVYQNSFGTTLIGQAGTKHTILSFPGGENPIIMLYNCGSLPLQSGVVEYAPTSVGFWGTLDGTSIGALAAGQSILLKYNGYIPFMRLACTTGITVNTYISWSTFIKIG